MNLGHHTLTSRIDPGSDASPRNSPLPFDVIACAGEVLREIPPLWTLESFVAVNPFMTLSSQPLSQVAAHMEHWLKANLYPSLAFYRQRMASGLLSFDDLSYAEKHMLSEGRWRAASAREFLDSKKDFRRRRGAAKERRSDAMVNAQVAKWLSSLLAETGAAWQVRGRCEELFATWLACVRSDRSLDIEGYGKVRRELRKLSASPQDSLTALINFLAPFDAGIGSIMRRLCYRNYGWLCYARFLDREAGSEGTSRSLAVQVLGIQAAYELALLRAGFSNPAEIAAIGEPNPDRFDQERLQLLELLQDAAERGARKKLVESFSLRRILRARMGRPRLQAAFCIDVRSEILRRHLEGLSPEIETIGFAGFFGLTLASPSAFGRSSARCPVLVKPTFEATLQGGASQAALLPEMATTAKKVLAMTFSYVEAFGLLYFPLMARSIFRGSASQDGRRFEAIHLHAFGSDRGLTLETKVAMARAVLKHSGLHARLGRLVLLCGHGASSPNNPHASSLDCGACGGHRGDVNAIAAAAILNDAGVRQVLEGSPYAIASDTYFLAGLHNTTSGNVTLFQEDRIPASHGSDLSELKRHLAAASLLALKERHASEDWRAAPSRTLEEAHERAASISEVRPEWGLAKNAFFIAARRETTRGMDLEGRAFLHDYDQEGDSGHETLELILTAPLIVAQAINMQYYASSVDPEAFGGGSKLLHSSLGSFGVLEGVDNNLRVGLPQQSVHDGCGLVHEPLRLQVFVEATTAAIDQVLQKHGQVADLVSKRWITLLAIGKQGEGVQRCYAPGVWRPER